jgi:hypothetical protein
VACVIKHANESYCNERRWDTTRLSCRERWGYWFAAFYHGGSGYSLGPSSYVEQSGTGTGNSLRTLVFSVSYHSTNAPFLCITRECTVGTWVSTAPQSQNVFPPEQNQWVTARSSVTAGVTSQAHIGHLSCYAIFCTSLYLFNLCLSKMKLYKDQRNAQVFNLFIYLLLP